MGYELTSKKKNKDDENDKYKQRKKKEKWDNDEDGGSSPINDRKVGKLTGLDVDEIARLKRIFSVVDNDNDELAITVTIKHIENQKEVEIPDNTWSFDYNEFK